MSCGRSGLAASALARRRAWGTYIAMPQFRYRYGHMEFDHPAQEKRLPPIRMTRAMPSAAARRVIALVAVSRGAR